MRRTKIVCTIGPASESPEMVRQLLAAGMDVARLNFSHGSHAEHKRRINTLRAVAQEMGRPVAIMLDNRGPEIRLGTFRGGRVNLQEGDIFTLTTEPVTGDRTRAFVNYPGLVRDVQPGQIVLLADGAIAMEVLEVRGVEVVCRVKNNGELSDRKKVNLPGVSLSLPALSEQDLADLEFGVENGVDFVAASFIRKAEDVLEIRRVLEEKGADIPIIAKIESREGVTNIDAILRVADGVMVARGDLGIEIPAEEVPLIQKMIIKKANRLGKPVITATQMLESMVTSPRPTRAEASDVANAILDGSDAVMLSEETAAGRYPAEAVATMARIAERAETALPYAEIIRRWGGEEHTSVTDAISYATCSAASGLKAAAILVSTSSGYTARMVARYRPAAPIIAITPSETVARRLRLVWGVVPEWAPATANTDEMIDRAVDTALHRGYIRNGDLVVITAGVPAGVAGTTNLIKVQVVGDVLARGTGVGHVGVSGQICLVKDAAEGKRKFKRGQILVTSATDRSLVPFMEEAAAIITEEGGLTSHAAVVGLNLGIPVVVGVEGACELFSDGMVVTVDPARGLIYRGRAQVR